MKHCAAIVTYKKNLDISLMNLAPQSLWVLNANSWLWWNRD